MQSDVRQAASSTDAIQELLNEHETIKGLLEQLTSSSGERDSMSVLEQLKGILTVHNAVEENLVYPALRIVAHHNAEALKLYNETAEADTMIFEIDSMLKEGDMSKISKKAEKLQAAILEHIEDEEHKAFKHLREKSDPQHTQMLNQSAREFRSKMSFQGAPTGSSSSSGMSTKGEA